jgi:hypothetical protein
MIDRIRKYTLAVLGILTVFAVSAQQQVNCDYIIDSSTVSITNYHASPGDTMCLEAGVRPHLYLKNIVGSEENPVVIINHQGKSIIESDLSYGIKFAACRYIQLTGAGVDSIHYGIDINRASGGNGLKIGGKSSDFEVNNLEISNTKYEGIVAKTDPDCTFSAVRDSFTMYNVIIHDNYIHNTGTEGMYIGNSFFLGHILVACDTVVLPHIIDGVQIYRNRVEYAGWDGIQVGCALHQCDIYDNYIYKDSQAEKTYQMSGIMINTGSSCNAYNNKIIDGQGSGIVVQGTGGQKYYNNLIVNAGRNYDFNEQILKQQFGIFCKYKYLAPPDSSFAFYNNTIINPKSDGIRFMNPESRNNKFSNNLIINPGAYIYYDTNGSVNTSAEDAYIHNYLDQSEMTMTNNIFSLDVEQQYFADMENYDFHLTFQSPAFNVGTNLLNAGISFDLDGNPRPYDRYFDIGAYELQSAADVIEQYKLLDVSIYPNPFFADTHLRLHFQEPQIIQASIYNNMGFKMMLFSDLHFNAGEEYDMILHLNFLAPGFYYLNIVDGKSNTTIKLIKVQ